MLVWSYVCLWVSNKSEFLWRHLLSLSLKLCKFMSFKQKRILMNKFVQSQLEVMLVCEFQTKANSDEDICWASLWSYVSWSVSNKSEFLWRHLFILSLKLFKFTSFKEKESWWRHLLSHRLKLSKFMNFKQNQILLKTFVHSQFEVI